ncbi:glutathione S-transferase family protein [Sneathiella litorea]|uniref:Glutathione S-transferase family protein n=1 Tax=Sneathiella litorea TaxID=2606216 RepID=A0A6L8W543_9PROT|nr:glutathione S-transferase family protein [Sneathiella litorea]MZR30221.1 glutathione S-transferase family protein [Sneathiella litorea]
MSDQVLELFSYKFSVYARIVRIILEEKGIDFKTHEVDPFAENVPENYHNIHPFKRVPAIHHRAFTLYETSAITQYLDEAFGGSSLQPDITSERARMRQIIAIIDNYGYQPLVRKVFSESVFGPTFGEETNGHVLSEGLQESAPVLSALEKLASDQGYIAASVYSLADAHVIPMIDYFTMAPEGAEMLSDYLTLARWWKRVKERPSTVSTRPVL